ncbi:hypothetical protein [Streptomyces sp. NPDC002779]|uniref:hypothetical protein n=1 Tax=Streptomyces sp. NPDC002779 TaxID=3364664 RepID=UPI0036ADAAD4
MSDTPQTEDPMVAALLREREGYVQRSMDDRVAQVDEQLKLRGHKPPRRGQPEHAPGGPPEDPQKAVAAQRAEPPKGRQQQGKSET